MARPFTLRHTLQFAVLLALSVLLVSCETVRYYGQAARGQMAIILGRQNIERLLEQPDLEPQLRAQLELALEIRAFAGTQLQLPVADNYETYVDLQREYVVWNVFAAPEFSVDPVNWCYPVAGCVSYRGYFSEAGARRFAERLQADGLDVYTGGIDAYSTLGWFDDSLLNTVMDRQPYQLAALIFHELAHQVVYVPGDTTFNESFATAVEREGLRRWLASMGDVQALERARFNRETQQAFVALIMDYRGRFESLYASDLGEGEMRAAKSALQAELRASYEALKEDWEGYAGYDDWFARSLNNAQLATVASYNDLVPGFSRLLAEYEGDLARFYEAVVQLAELPRSERDVRLAD